MKLPTAEALLAEFDSEEEFLAELPDRPISSLRDLQYVYGRLYTLATAGSGEYAPYLTPNEARDLFDEEESLIVVRVDLSGESPKLDAQPVEIQRYGSSLVEQVAHCKYNAARGIDHSITHRSGRDKSPEKLAEYAIERLSKWPTDDIVSEIAADHEDGWIIEGLSQLGEDEAVAEAITEAITNELGGTATSLLTVRVRLEADGPYQWPGEVEVFNAAMRARKLDKLVSKGKATESAGDSWDLITGESARTVGTAEDPLNYYLGKQLEKFPGFDVDEAWRTHALSEDAAITLMNAAPFIDACTYSTFGASVFYLPYFRGELTVERARELYRLLRLIAAEGDTTPVEVAYRELDGKHTGAFDLRFYVSAIMRHQSKRYDVFGDTMNGELLYPDTLADAHENTLMTWVFDDGHERISAPLPVHENWRLLSGEGYLPTIATGRYFSETFSRADDDQNASADDTRIEALVSVLSGQPIPVELLLSEYVDRLIDDQGDDFPHYHVSSQFAQLTALAEAGLLTTNDADHREIAHEPSYTTQMTPSDTPIRADGGSAAAARTQKLEQFLEATPALHGETDVSQERRGAFLLGALIGQVGSYQQRAEGRSKTVIDSYPIKSMSVTRLKRITQEVLDKNVVYSREQGLGSTMYAEVVDELVDTLTHHDPDDWRISTDDLRFYYALGVSYGLNNYTKTDTKQTETDE
ncbi:type I-B CRISPR-associated protein Cas8b/Csh1 [Natronomonas sp. EA1]|uniref:type I-B CRISPR-associated protein Cas8b/Csh1 n=1 Tax=Natronomonas sp. EA1 TaxID=3421655 RepID=UPI003EB6E59B